MARESRKFFERLSELIAEKKKQRYSLISSWIKRKISFFVNEISRLMLETESLSLVDRKEQIGVSIADNASIREMSSKT